MQKIHTKLNFTNSLIFFCLILTIVTFLNSFQTTNRVSPLTITSVFGKTLQFTPPAPQNFQEIFSPTTPISIFLNPITSSLTLRTFFRCSTSCGYLWLEIPLHDNQVMELVLFHPYLENYHFFPVKDPALTLFQKELHFSSIPDFFQAIPQGKIAVDPYLALYFPSSTDLLNSLTLTLDSSPDYILTSFKVPRRFGDAYEWQRQLSLTDVVITDHHLNFSLNYKPTSPDTKMYLTNFESYLL